MSACLFCRIARGEIPARKLFEDDQIVAFHDLHPAAPVHLLVIPKVHLESLADVRPEHEPILGRLLAVGARLARDQGCEAGFRTIINTGRVGGTGGVSSPPPHSGRPGPSAAHVEALRRAVWVHSVSGIG